MKVKRVDGGDGITLTAGEYVVVVWHGSSPLKEEKMADLIEGMLRLLK